MFENIALFSLPLTGTFFLFLQLEVIILDLGPENSFVKKGRISLSLTETLAFTALFHQDTESGRSNPIIPLPPNGNSNLINLSRNSKIALIITTKLFARKLASGSKFLNNCTLRLPSIMEI